MYIGFFFLFSPDDVCSFFCETIAVLSAECDYDWCRTVCRLGRLLAEAYRKCAHVPERYGVTGGGCLDLQK